MAREGSSSNAVLVLVIRGCGRPLRLGYVRRELDRGDISASRFDCGYTSSHRAKTQGSIFRAPDAKARRAEKYVRPYLGQKPVSPHPGCWYGVKVNARKTNTYRTRVPSASNAPLPAGLLDAHQPHILACMDLCSCEMEGGVSPSQSLLLADRWGFLLA
jgi:hypothetical protein